MSSEIEGLMTCITMNQLLEGRLVNPSLLLPPPPLCQPNTRPVKCTQQVSVYNREKTSLRVLLNPLTPWYLISIVCSFIQNGDRAQWCLSLCCLLSWMLVWVGRMYLLCIWSVNSQFSSFDFLQCLTISCCLALYKTLSELHSWGFTVLLVFESLLYLFEIQD